MVRLSRDGLTRTYIVHRLVAEAFIPNPLRLETVNHKNEVKDDNRAENLEWLSQADNVRAYFTNHPDAAFSSTNQPLR